MRTIGLVVLAILVIGLLVVGCNAIVGAVTGANPSPTPKPTVGPMNTPAPTSIPAATNAPQPTPSALGCSVQHDYVLQTLTEVSTHSEPGWFLHVEFWTDGQPEREAVLDGGRYYVTPMGLRGHVWEYGPNCTRDQVVDQVNDHIARRKAQGVNNAGWADAGLVEQLFSIKR